MFHLQKRESERRKIMKKQYLFASFFLSTILAFLLHVKANIQISRRTRVCTTTELPCSSISFGSETYLSLDTRPLEVIIDLRINTEKGEPSIGPYIGPSFGPPFGLSIGLSIGLSVDRSIGRSVIEFFSSKNDYSS